MEILAIIPARAGSKGLRFKNKRNLAGKPMICYTFNAGPNAFSAASIFHFTQYTPKDVKLAMEKEGIPVRIE